MQKTQPIVVRAVVRAGLLESVYASEEIDFEYVDADVYDGDLEAAVSEYSTLGVEVV